ncbi:MAG: GNAT family N-acetyltransferase [Dermatophilaceae bacterium]|nr:GNAT family N-acetyltransferase [Dermatophilaceae bacterium]
MAGFGSLSGAPSAQRGAGRGRRLYDALLERVTARGYRMAVAGITQPNDASVRLHHAMGFETVGTYARIGWKLGEWRDVMRLQLPLGAPLATGEDPPEPT